MSETNFMEDITDLKSSIVNDANFIMKLFHKASGDENLDASLITEVISELPKDLTLTWVAKVPDGKTAKILARRFASIQPKIIEMEEMLNVVQSQVPNPTSSLIKLVEEVDTVLGIVQTYFYFWVEVMNAKNELKEKAALFKSLEQKVLGLEINSKIQMLLANYKLLGTLKNRNLAQQAINEFMSLYTDIVDQYISFNQQDSGNTRPPEEPPWHHHSMGDSSLSTSFRDKHRKELYISLEKLMEKTRLEQIETQDDRMTPTEFTSEAASSHLANICDQMAKLGFPEFISSPAEGTSTDLSLMGEVVDQMSKKCLKQEQRVRENLLITQQIESGLEFSANFPKDDKRVNSIYSLQVVVSQATETLNESSSYVASCLQSTNCLLYTSDAADE